MQVTFASAGIQSNRGSGMVVFDALKVSCQKFAYCDLTALRDIDQPAELFNEQIDSVCLEPLFGQRMARSEMLPKIINGIADFTQRDPMMSSSRIQHVRFH